MTEPDAAVVVVAAGSGTRVGGRGQQGPAAPAGRPGGGLVGAHGAGAARRTPRGRRAPARRAARRWARPSPLTSATARCCWCPAARPGTPRSGRRSRCSPTRSTRASSRSSPCTTLPARWPTPTSSSARWPRPGEHGGAIPVVPVDCVVRRDGSPVGARRAGGRADAAGIPGGRPAGGLPGGRRRTASPAPTRPSCVERYAGLQDRRGAVGPGQPQDHLPRRTSQLAERLVTAGPGERLEHPQVVRPADPHRLRRSLQRARPGRRARSASTSAARSTAGSASSSAEAATAAGGHDDGRDDPRQVVAVDGLADDVVVDHLHGVGDRPDARHDHVRLDRAAYALGDERRRRHRAQGVVQHQRQAGRRPARRRWCARRRGSTCASESAQVAQATSASPCTRAKGSEPAALVEDPAQRDHLDLDLAHGAAHDGDTKGPARREPCGA